MTTEVALQLTASGSNGNGNGNGAHPESSNGANGFRFDETPPAMLPSSYLRFLPAIYWQDSFMGRFLRIFEDILAPIQKDASRRTDYFDPGLASSSMLRFMASWVGADQFGELPDEQLRGLLRKAVTLNQLRGTKRGLRMALEAITGKRPYITEYSPGLVLGEDAVLGLNTSLSEGVALNVHILFNCNESEIDQALMHAIIRHYKPAGAVYTVTFAA